MHETSLIFTIAVCLIMAFVFGFAAAKFRLSPIVGYLLAGVIIGPHTPGLVANADLAAELSDLGVILLMFGVGLHFSPGDLLVVSRLAFFGAVPQVLVSTALAAGLASFWGWSWGVCFVFAMALSVASTIVVIGELEKRHVLTKNQGKCAVGWLLAQDLFVVLALVVLPALAPALRQPIFDLNSIIPILPSLGIAAAKAAVFIGVMLFVGRGFLPWLLMKVADTGSRELFTLFVIGVPIGTSLVAAHQFGVSLALGAFLAGIVLNQSELSHHAAAKALPFQDAFAVLFFVSAGMSFEPSILLSHPLELCLAVAFVLIVNPAIAFLLIMFSVRASISTAATISASLSQIGEFSLVLAALGLKLGLEAQFVYNIIVGAVLVSICLNSIVFRVVESVALKAERFQIFKRTPTPDSLDDADSQIQRLHDHVVLIGYGRVGAKIGDAIRAHKQPFVVIEQEPEIVQKLRTQEIPFVQGRAEALEVLHLAGLERSRLVVITSPDPVTTRLICEHAHRLNPNVSMIVRTHSEDELHYLENQPGVSLVVFAEGELAKAIETQVSARLVSDDNAV